MRTKIIITGTSGTTFISSGTVDLYDDVPISLNYNIANIREPDKRNADFSKTITAPGTDNNNKFLAHIYEIGVDRLYDPNKKAEARVLVDDNQVFKGYMRLANIRNLRGNKIEYDLEIKGRLDDLFTNIKDKKLTDITWTDLDHVYNKSNQITSWSATVGSNYVYPFIDYGYSINKIDYEVKNFAPATYVKEIWDRIFSYAGFQYTSTFLTSAFFKSLIIPFTSEKMRLTEAQIQAREFQASRLTTDNLIKSFPTNNNPTIAYTLTVPFNDDSTSPNSDSGGNYSTATFKYTVPTSGYYNFTSQILLSVTNVSGNGTINITGWSRMIRQTNVVAYGQNINILTPNFSTQTVNMSFSSYCNAGDLIYCDLYVNTGGVNSADLNVLIGSYFYAKVNSDLAIGDTITYSTVLPQTMKMNEFLINIIKMFNLYIEYDKDVPNKMRIEPRNDFYTSTIQDWSTLLDASQPIEIQPMGALDAKRYIFRYKKDGDWLNKLYQDTYGQGTEETYGQRIKDVDNDFLTNDNVMESIFSATPLYSDGASDRVYPRIEKVDPVTQVISQMATNVRILYYGGLKTCQTWNFYDQALTNVTAQTQYPYCGHLDDAATPILDLSFGVPKEIFYVPAWNASYTNNNLYNKYWRQMIEEITDKNSSIVTAWFRLRPSDIMLVDFRHIYRFNNQNFRLNKIFDYNPIHDGLTKCEFIKLINGTPFVTNGRTITGGRNAQFTT